VRGPFGHGWNLELDGRDVVVAAGGIGIAPLRSAIMELIRRHDRLGRIVLVVGARDPSHLLYERQFDGWRDAGLDVVVTVDAARPGWSGRIGCVPDVVADVMAERGLRPADMSALTCGPDVMMRLVAERLISRRVEAAAIQLTVERNMQCGVGLCGHCQMGGVIVCRDGPVVIYPEVTDALAVPEL
jgi:anaerobic sulfite reductase subunit B